MNSGLAGKRRFVLVLGCLTGLAAISIDMSLPAIPEMVRELATSLSLGQQIVTWFMAGLALGQLPAGLVSDRIGRMPVLYAGVLTFIAGGAICAFTGSIEQMLAGRFLQGIGASAGAVIARAIVRDVASGKEAARLLTIMVMIFTAAPMLAPMAGSLLVTVSGWRAPFIVIAVCGGLMLVGVNRGLRETRLPVRDHHILRQLWISLREFSRHRQCLFGVLLVLLTASGFLSLITSSSALIIEIYGYPVSQFGFIFALAGFAILLGSTFNRRLLLTYSSMQVMGVGAVLIGVAALQMLLIVWLDAAPFWWLWGNVCLYMLGTGLLLPNATAMALDPVPAFAGVAASIIGTVQNLAAALSSLVSSLLYDGSIRNVVINMGICGTAVFVSFLLRAQILGSKPLFAEEGAD